MRRLTFRFLAGLFTFLIGISAASLWLVAHYTSPITVEPAKNVPVQLSANQERTYERGIAGSATANNPRGGSFTSFHSSDGMSFTKWSTDCGSLSRADKELQKRLKRALETVSREPVFDESGRRVGEKVVASFPPNYDGSGPASLLWTYGSEFFHVDSASVENISEYRKDFNQ